MFFAQPVYHFNFLECYQHATRGPAGDVGYDIGLKVDGHFFIAAQKWEPEVVTWLAEGLWVNSKFFVDTNVSLLNAVNAIDIGKEHCCAKGNYYSQHYNQMDLFCLATVSVAITLFATNFGGSTVDVGPFLLSIKIKPFLYFLSYSVTLLQLCSKHSWCCVSLWYCFKEKVKLTWCYSLPTNNWIWPCFSLRKCICVLVFKSFYFK